MFKHVPWHIFFPYFLKQIWLHRNTVVFKKKILNSSQIINLALFNATEFYCNTPHSCSQSSTLTHHTRSSITWQRPPNNFLKLNVDGSAKNNLVGAGGILRDSLGNWVAGFSAFIGFGNSLSAELWGIFKGIELAISLNCKNLIVETDSQVSKNLITTDTSLSHHPFSTLIENCRYLIMQLDDFKIQHVLREGNSCADALTNHGRINQLHLTVFDSLPPFLSLLFLHDLLEIGNIRRSSSSFARKPP